MQESAQEMHLSRVILPVLLSLIKKDIKQGGQHLRTAWLLLLAMMLKKGPRSQAIMAAFLDAGQLCSACCSSHSTPSSFTKHILLLLYCSRHAHLSILSFAFLGLLILWACCNCGHDTDPITVVVPSNSTCSLQGANSHYSLAHCCDVVSGGVTVMMAALGQHKEAALGVRMFLTNYLNTPAMTLEQQDTVKALMCRMQGVLRLSSMLCPTFSLEEEALLAPGESPCCLTST